MIKVVASKGGLLVGVCRGGMKGIVKWADKIREVFSFASPRFFLLLLKPTEQEPVLGNELHSFLSPAFTYNNRGGRVTVLSLSLSPPS